MPIQKGKKLHSSSEHNFDPPIGTLINLSCNVATITAPNASPMTFKGTQTYLVGANDEVALIDPGPAEDSHFEAIRRSLYRKKLVGIFVTHSHLDHSPLAKKISNEYGVSTYGFGSSTDGRSETMKKIANLGTIGGGEGVDLAFSPDIKISSGDYVSNSEWTLEAIHLPGHMSNHLCFSLNDGEALFSGDLVMGWSTTLISPPDGDIGQYKDSLRRLLERKEDLYFPGHGPPLLKAKKVVSDHLMHRLDRENAILACVNANGINILDIVNIVYSGLSGNLKYAAARNVLAHLLELKERGLINSDDDDISIHTVFKKLA